MNGRRIDAIGPAKRGWKRLPLAIALVSAIELASFWLLSSPDVLRLQSHSVLTMPED